ncbi:uncharacterized protein LOC143276673 [Babylonia areolata]|uniref:uncharacterized protein LOC143276673 n=1 Tax=Babylonia areolata TaxID=304850 RepID=UPI003FD39462
MGKRTPPSPPSPSPPSTTTTTTTPTPRTSLGVSRRRHILRVCAKHGDHSNFHPISKLSQEHFLEGMMCGRGPALRLVQALARLVVRVRVMVGVGGSPEGQGGGGRRRRRGGAARTCTGVVTSVSEGRVSVMVPLHAVEDDAEAVHTTADFFYDGEDDSDVITVRGLSLVRCDHQMTAELTCRSCPELNQRFQRLRGKMTTTTPTLSTLSKTDLEKQEAVRSLEGSMAVLISHPHGFSKRVTFGSFCGTDLVQVGKLEDDTSSNISGGSESDWALPTRHRMSSPPPSEADVAVVEPSLPSPSLLSSSSQSSPSKRLWGTINLRGKNIELQQPVIIEDEQSGDRQESPPKCLSKSAEDNSVCASVDNQTASEMENASSGVFREVWRGALSLWSAFHRLVYGVGEYVFGWRRKASGTITRVFHSAASCPGSSGGVVVLIGRQVWARLDEALMSLPVFLHVGVTQDGGVAVPVVVNGSALRLCD